jgi:hypothetical protein
MPQLTQGMWDWGKSAQEAEAPRAMEPVPINDSSDTDRRIGLVIGNGGYSSSPLKNPVNDASDISSRLERLGFSVTDGRDMSRKEMYSAIREFGNNLKKGGVGLFYYAGHGMQVKGKNYLIPVGVDIQSEDEVESEAIDAGLVMRKMESAGNAMNMVFLDACRDNPFARSFRSNFKGLAQMDAPSGSLIVYSTAPGSVAADGKGRNGTFTKNLLLHLNTPGLEVGKMLRKVRVSVKKDTGGKQVPWESSSLEGDFYFVGRVQQAESMPDISLPPEVKGGDDYFEKIAKEREASKAKWNDWQTKLSERYSKNNNMDKGNTLKPSEKAQMWDGFLAQYSTDNPYSAEDQLIRSKAMDRLKYWRNYKEPKPTIIKKPPVTVREEPAYGSAFSSKLRSSYRDLSVSQVQSMSNMSIREKDEWSFYGHSTISHSYSHKFISGDKVVVDNATGLMWHENGSNENMEWNKARQWVRSLNSRGYAGYSDWRLPTVEEAASLLESSKNNDRYIDSIFSNKQWGTWTGDTKNGSEAAWFVNFSYGNVIWHHIGINRFVRPVRSGR